MAQNRPSSSSFRRAHTNSFVTGVRGLRALKGNRDLQPVPPPFTATATNFAVPTPAAFVPTIRSDGAKIFQRKIIIKRK